MTQMYVLFEHAAGYALFHVKEFEEVGMLLPQVEASVTDLSRFNSVVKLVGFKAFKSAVNALENLNSITEGVVPDDLQLFLQTFLPKSSKREKVILGVAEPKLGAGICEILNISCQHIGAVPEIMRGIRLHFHNLVKGFSAKSSGTAQLGLGHSYSRAKVKFNVNRVDNMIIQSIALLDQLDKDINTFSMRIREWYSYHFPELFQIIPENYLYAKVAHFIKNRKELNEAKLPLLEEIVMDSAKTKAIYDASRSSMGMDISPVDLLNIELFASKVVNLADYRKQLVHYLHSKMQDIAPNLGTLIGDQVAARLISHAGSLTNLAKCPASTVQVLGAEKALFRAIKSRTNTPKYGLLFHSSYIGRAGKANKGRISRYLANKCSIAARIDCFTDQPNCVYGEKLKQQVEDRLKFYETGEIPKKNIEVMQEAILEMASMEKSSKKKKKKKKSHLENGDLQNSIEENAVDETEAAEISAKKSKKRKKHSESEDLQNSSVEAEVQKDVLNNEEEGVKKKKKKKRKLEMENGDE